MSSLIINTIDDLNRDLFSNIATDAEVVNIDPKQSIDREIEDILLNRKSISRLDIIASENDINKLETELEKISNRDIFQDNGKIVFHTFNLENKTFPVFKELKVKDLLAFTDTNNLSEDFYRTSENRELNLSRSTQSDRPDDKPIVTTDKNDYPPGSTAKVSGSNFQPGETIELQILHTDGIPNTGGGHDPWQVTDGSKEDLDGKADGKFETTWYVNPDDSANSAFKLTATGLSSKETAIHHFTDSDPAVQIFYIPQKEADIRSAFYAVNTGFGLTGNIKTVISITVSTDNSIIYYDHWEDGYESDINNPTQSTTQIWGDNNPSNGIAPGYTTDVLHKGNIIALQNSVNLTTPTTDYDGEDKIGSSKAIVLSRAYWPDATSGELIAEASSVYDTSKWGTSYTVPLGENYTSTNPTAVNFEYTSLFVTASKNNTTLTIKGADTTGDNVADGDITTTLSEGQSYFLNGGILVGTTVTGSRPIQAQILTGDIGSSYATRAYTLVPTDQWGNSYYTPVGTEVSGKNTDVFLYNPKTSGSITVNYTTKGSSGTVSVPAGTVVRQTLPIDATSGAHFYTTTSTDTFFATTAFDSEKTTHDWGFSLIPEKNLTPVIQVGWGPGNGAKDANGNPLWVMATAATTIYVDYDGDGVAPHTDINGTQYDAKFSLGALETIQITDTKNNDFDQSGIRVYTVDGTNLAGAWGQNTDAAAAGTSLDLGTEVLPLPIAHSWKKFDLVGDVNSNGKVDPGDTIEFTINIKNQGEVVLGNVNINDIVPSGVTYVAGSGKINGTSIGDDGAGTIFAFDNDRINNGIDGGKNIGNIPVGGSANVKYRMLVKNPYNGSLNGITNSASVDSNQGSIPVAVNVPLVLPTKTKTLYLSDPNDLDRIDPANSTPVDTTTTISNVLSTASSVTITSDNFSSGDYAGGTDWKADWTESLDGGSATGGTIRINNNGQLRFKQTGSGTNVRSGDAIQRSVDLSSYANATLSFDWQTTNLEENIQILISNSSTGGTFTPLANYTGNHSTSTTASFDISSYISGDTTIKIQNNSGSAWNENDDIALFDTIVISATTVTQVNFNQSISMKSDFEMFSGDPVTVTAYINALSGTPTTSSNIGATLTYDSGTIATVSKPTSVTLVSGTTYKVTWTGNLSSNTTIPAGEDVSLKIQNNQTDVNFTVLSDSSTYPSKIDLPTTTFVNVDSIEFYDNISTNSSATKINAASRGDTVYVRVKVSDPFGDSDITKLLLNIKDEQNNPVVTNANVTTLVSSSVDPSGNSIKIYEYAWNIGTSADLENYTITAEATEGLETTPITDTGSTTFTVNDGTAPDVLINNASNTEGNQLVFDVTLSTTSATDIVLDLAAIAGTATAVSDYETTNFEYSTNGGTTWIAAGGTNGTQVTIPAGSTAIKIRIDSTSDTADEPNETFTLGVNSVVSGSVGSFGDTGTGTINDDDATPSISIDDVSLTEGNSNNKEFDFTVSLSNPSAQPVTVQYSTANSTATSGSDYTAASNQTVTFAPGETTKTITVMVAGDTTVESNETFTVGLSNATNATISDNSGTGTILNDDSAALLSINDFSVTEGDSGTKTLTFTVTRSGTLTNAISVNYATANNTATTGSNDYQSASGTLNFASNETSQTISITINGDATPEANETFYVNLSNATATTGTVTIADSQGIGTITNDDVSGIISGSVKADTNNDNVGDTSLSGITIELLDSSNNPIDSDPNTSGTQQTLTTTDSSGNYTFSNVTPGSYIVKQTDLTGYNSISDGDSTNGSDDTPTNSNTNDNLIPVTITSGETDSGNDFVDEQTGSIIGTVLIDTNNDNVGDSPLSGVTIQLFNSGGTTVIATTTTATNGSYSFANLAPGNYDVKQTNLSGYEDVSDSDGGNLNLISGITVNSGAIASGKDFVDEALHSISGTVQSDTNNDNTGDSPLSGVTIELLNSSGQPIDSDPIAGGTQPTTTTTAADGSYSFTGIAPGNYQVKQTNLAGYIDISDIDGGNLNNISVNLNTGNSTGNNFVDKKNLFNGTEVSETLTATSSNDFITGYKGQDTLSGNGGNDTFYFTETSDGVDIITDFNDGDKLDFRAIVTNELSGNSNPFPSYVKAISFGSHTMIQVDFDASGSLIPKDVVLLENVLSNTIDATDFIFT